MILECNIHSNHHSHDVLIKHVLASRLLGQDFSLFAVKTFRNRKEFTIQQDVEPKFRQKTLSGAWRRTGAAPAAGSPGGAGSGLRRRLHRHAAAPATSNGRGAATWVSLTGSS